MASNHRDGSEGLSGLASGGSVAQERDRGEAASVPLFLPAAVTNCFFSKAPMSHLLPCGLFTPRWSVAMRSVAVAQPFWPFGMAFMAGLPISRAMVWVGPPLFARLLATLG